MPNPEGFTAWGQLPPAERCRPLRGGEPMRHEEPPPGQEPAQKWGRRYFSKERVPERGS